MRNGKLGLAGLALFAVGFGLSVYVFVVVQILQSYPFYGLGAFGDRQFILLTYTQTLEVAGPLSMVGFAVWQYTRSGAPSRKVRVARSLGLTLLVFGAIAAVMSYVEIHLLWGEIWYGLHFWQGLPGGGGYPWGDEQVAYNLCFIREPSYSPLTPDCYVLNYNWVLGLGLAAVILGALVRMFYEDSTGGVSLNAEGVGPRSPMDGAATLAGTLFPGAPPKRNGLSCLANREIGFLIQITINASKIPYRIPLPNPKLFAPIW